jgi:hypothetical protein
MAGLDRSHSKIVSESFAFFIHTSPLLVRFKIKINNHVYIVYKRSLRVYTKVFLP